MAMARRARSDFERFVSLVRRIAARTHAWVPLEDRLQAGMLGLVAALDAYHPEIRISLVRYVRYRIRSEISAAADDFRPGIRLSGRSRRLMGHLFSDGTDEEHAERYGLGLMTVTALRSGAMAVPMSGEILRRIGDRSMEPEGIAFGRELRSALRREIARLPMPARRWVRQRYGLQGSARSAHTIARAEGVSQQWVNRVIGRALDVLYRRLSGRWA